MLQIHGAGLGALRIPLAVFSAGFLEETKQPIQQPTVVISQRVQINIDFPADLSRNRRADHDNQHGRRKKRL